MEETEKPVTAESSLDDNVQAPESPNLMNTEDSADGRPETPTAASTGGTTSGNEGPGTPPSGPKSKTKKPRSSSSKKTGTTEEKRRRRILSQGDCESEGLAATSNDCSTTEQADATLSNGGTVGESQPAISASPGVAKRKVSKASTEERKRRGKKDNDGSMNGYSSSGDSGTNSNSNSLGKKKRTSRRASGKSTDFGSGPEIVDPRCLNLTGQVVGNYEVGKRLGKGGASVVYVALNKETNDQVAIKQLYLDPEAKKNIEPLMEEIELMKRLEHVNIVRYIEHVLTEENLFVVMEFMSKGSLASILKECGTFPENLACMYIAQVLDGLEYIHSKGIVHRDIKGDNLLTTADSVLKLADFGVACVLTENQGNSRSSYSQERQVAGEGPEVVGTPYWMAPEVIEMKPATPASDIWSLGCTLIELLVGNPPFFELGPLSALFRIVEDRSPPIPSDLSLESRDFLECCFQRDPKKRKTATELKTHPLILKYADLVPTTNSSHKISLKEVRNTIRDKSRQNAAPSRPSVISIFQQDAPQSDTAPVDSAADTKCSIIVPPPSEAAVIITASDPTPPVQEPQPQKPTNDNQPQSNNISGVTSNSAQETCPSEIGRTAPPIAKQPPPPPPPPPSSQTSSTPTTPTTPASPASPQQHPTTSPIQRSPSKKRGFLANIFIISRKEQEDAPPKRPVYKQ